MVNQAYFPHPQYVLPLCKGQETGGQEATVGQREEKS